MMQTTLTTSALDCDLRVAARGERGALVLGYEFRNRSARVAFLFNVLHRGADADANLIYAQSAGGVLLLSKKIIPVPANVDVEKPDVPYVTKVEPGDTFREKLEVTVPVKLWAPYAGTAGTAAEGMELDAWFELGFFLAPDASVAKDAGGKLVVYPFAAEKQTVMRVGPLGRLAIR